MSLMDALVDVRTPKLLVPDEFKPTWEGRGWVVSPFNNPWWTIPAAIAPAMLATILIFMDQQITAVIVNRRENKLKVRETNFIVFQIEPNSPLAFSYRIDRKGVATTWICLCWPF